jgi:ferredoxin
MAPLRQPYLPSYTYSQTRPSLGVSAVGCPSQEEPLVMTYVIVEACIGVKDRACVDVCPVDCIYEGEDMLYIQPDECIDCGACEPECPVTAIFPEEDVPENMTAYIAKNRDVFNSDSPPGRPKR